MQKALVLALAFCLVGVLAFGGELGTKGTPIYMLLVPSTEGATVQEVGEAIAEDLYDLTGLYIEASLQADYTAMIEAFATSEGDTFGFPTTDQYIRIHNRTDGEVTPRLCSIRYGNAYYFSSVYAHRGSGIETLEDLDGKIWIYNDTGSTSGYVLPNDVFTLNDIEPNDIVESGGHSNSMAALINGQGDYCTGYGSPPGSPDGWEGAGWGYGDDPEMWLWDDYNSSLYRDELLGTCYDLRRAMKDTYDLDEVLTDIGVVMTFGPVPNDCAAFGPGFPEDVADTLVAAIQEHIETEEGQKLWGNPNFYEWTAVREIDDSYYDGYRELLGL